MGLLKRSVTSLLLPTLITIILRSGRVMSASTENDTPTMLRPLYSTFDSLREDGTNYTEWLVNVTSTVQSQGLEALLHHAPSPNHGTAAQDRLVKHLLVTKAPPSMGQALLRINHANKVYEQLVMHTSQKTVYDAISENETPDLLQCESASIYVANIRKQRSAIMAIDQTHAFCSAPHLTFLLLKGLPNDDTESKMLKTMYSKKKTAEDAESLISLIRDLNITGTVASSASASAGRRRYSQPPGVPNNRYKCSHCLCDSHALQDCNLKSRGLPGLYAVGGRKHSATRASRQTPSAAAAVVESSSSAADISAIASLAKVMKSMFTNDVNSTTSQYTSSQDALLDSGASHHMLPNKAEFTQYNPTSIPVTLANGSCTMARGIGTAALNFPFMPLLKCLHVPQLSRPLISASRLAKNFSILFQGSKFFIFKEKLPTPPSPVAQGQSFDGVYRFTPSSEHPKQECVASCALLEKPIQPKNSFKIPARFLPLHRIFNHIGMNKLRQFTQQNPSLMPKKSSRVVASAENDNKEHEEAKHSSEHDSSTTTTPCLPCLVGKSTRAPHHSSTPSVSPLDRICVDTAGPFPPSIDKNKYMCVIIDDATGYPSAVFAPTKGGVAAPIIAKLKQLQNQKQKSLLIFHSDNAPELCKGTISRWALAQGTKMTTTVPNHSSSNGIAERAIRSIEESSKAALVAANLPDQFWDHAYADSVSKFAVLPSSRHSTASPHKLFYDEQPLTSHFQPFGQFGYVVNTSSDKSALRPRAIAGRYLQAPTHQKYLVYIPSTGRIVTCRPTEFTQTPPPSANVANVMSCDGSTELPSPPRSIHEALRRPPNEAVKWAAKHDEFLDKMFRMKAWVPCTAPSNTKLVHPKWVYTVKTKEDGTLDRFSARCTVRGDLMKPGKHYNPSKTAAQTPSHTAHRIFYADAAINSAYVESYDVPNAYPRAPSDPDYPTFLKQPPRSDGSLTYPNQDIRLDGAQQGAPDAGNRWERHRNSVFQNLGWKGLASEPSAFLYDCPRTKEKARLLASTDDFVVSSTSLALLERLRKQLMQTWNVTVQSPVKQHAGLKVDRQEDGTIVISCPKHVEKLLATAGLTDCKPAATPHMDNLDLSARKEGEPRQCDADINHFQTMIGQARFITDTVAYPLSFITSALATQMSDPSTRHFQALKRLCRFLANNRDICLEYRPSKKDEKPQLEAWVDSDWASNTDNRRSRTGIVFTYGGDVVHYRSFMQKCISTSSAEAEYVAAAAAAKDLTWIRALAKEWHISLSPEPTALHHPLMIDNQGAIAMANANGPTRRSKHIDICHHYLNEKTRAGIILPTHVPTTKQKADMFTKPLPRLKFLAALKSLKQSMPLGLRGGVDVQQSTSSSNPSAIHVQQS